MSSVPSTVGSYAQKSFGDPLPGVILYPALGAPEVLSRDDHKWIHLLMLLPATVNSKDEGNVRGAKDLINRHLKLVAEFETLRDVKDGSQDLSLDLLCDLVKDPAKDIQLGTFDSKHPWDGEGSLREIGWSGFLHEKMLDRYSTITGLGTVVWEVGIRVEGLNGAHRTLWNEHFKLFLHWWDDKGDYQSNALYGILKDAKYCTGTKEVPNGQVVGAEDPKSADKRGFKQYSSAGPTNEVPNEVVPLFVGDRLRQDLSPDTGKRLWKGVDLERCPGQTDPDVPLMDVHPVYNLREGKAGKALNLGFISDLHLVNKFRILKNCDLYPIPKGGKGGRGTVPHLKLIGDKIQDTVDVLAELIQQMADDKDVEAIVFGGDLVDFCEDNWPKEREVKLRLEPSDKPYDRGMQERSNRFENIWKACWLDPDPLIREDNQQAGTTTLGLFHMILSKLVAVTDKPVFILAGNHDAYQQPFGISPRVFVGQALEKLPPFLPDAIVGGTGAALGAFLGGPVGAKVGASIVGGLAEALLLGCGKAYDIEAQKGNDGIPADCNLTVHEASLAFGPSYSVACLENVELRMLGRPKGSVNFVPDTMTLFYLLFNPMRSWTFPLGKHQMVVLDWGDGEGMLMGGDSFGHLPHATDTLLDDDQAVLDHAVVQGERKGTPVVSLSHFAWACYDPHVPISGRVPPVGTCSEDGRTATFAISDPVLGVPHGPEEDPVVTKYTYGACRRGRKKMYEYLKEGKVYLTLSGHTHRAGVYVLDGTSTVSVENHLSKLKDPLRRTPDPKLPSWHEEQASVTAYHFDEIAWKRSGPGLGDDPASGPCHLDLKNFKTASGKPCSLLVVSDSAGPIPRENRGHFEAWGSARSSWTYVGFDADGHVIRLESRKAHKTSNSAPRMAVTLDYVEFQRCGQMHGWWANRDTPSDRKEEMEDVEKERLKGLNQAQEQAAKRAKIALDMAGASNASLLPWSTLKHQERLHNRAFPLDRTSTKDPEINPVRGLPKAKQEVLWEHFGYESSLLTNFVSEPLDQRRIDALTPRNGEAAKGFSLFHNHLAIDLPKEIRIKKVSLFVWEGMEMEIDKNRVHPLKRCWLHLKPHGDGEWFLDPADNNATVLDDLRNVLSDHSGLLGSHPSHKSNVFLYLEFDSSQKYRDYDLSSPWIVHACWEDKWINDELGRRILIYRNTKAHENPDHELWRLAEYEGTEKTQNLPSSVANSSQTQGN